MNSPALRSAGMTADEISLVGEIVPFWSARAPERIALVEGERTMTYRELDAAVRSTAVWLQSSGVRPGDRVMLVCENCCAAVAIVLACAVLGAWPVIVNARLSDRELDEIADHCGARRIIVAGAGSLRARAHAERLGAVPTDPASYGPVWIAPLNEKAEAEPTEGDPAGRIAALIYTSGTTGEPKGVMLSHANLLFVARASGRMRVLDPDDRVYAVLPISHILGFTGVLLGSLLHGARVHLASRFDPPHVLAALERDRISVLIGTPSMYALLAEYASRKGPDRIPAPALRLISSAGAPLDAATKSAAEGTFGRVLHNGYGITECSPTIALTALDAPRADCSIGRLLPGIEARLVDAQRNPVGSSEVGELEVRGPGVMKGYYRAPAATTLAIDPDGWFRTGDLARVEDGNYFIVGRSKEMIIRFGYNVYPAEIEGVLNAHPAVARSAVVGRQAEGGEEVVAFVQPVAASQTTAEEIASYAATKLAPYKHPSRIVFLEQMPMTAAGKVLKGQLAAMC